MTGGGGFRNASGEKRARFIEVLKNQVTDLEATCARAETRFKETYSAPFSGYARAFPRSMAGEKAQAEIESSKLLQLSARLEAEPAFLETCLATLWADFEGV